MRFINTWVKQVGSYFPFYADKRIGETLVKLVGFFYNLSLSVFKYPPSDCNISRDRWYVLVHEQD